MCGNAPKKVAILKQLQTHFKAKHEKGMGTPSPSLCPPDVDAAMILPCQR